MNKLKFALDWFELVKAFVTFILAAALLGGVATPTHGSVFRQQVLT